MPSVLKASETLDLGGGGGVWCSGKQQKFHNTRVPPGLKSDALQPALTGSQPRTTQGICWQDLLGLNSGLGVGEVKQTLISWFLPALCRRIPSFSFPTFAVFPE